MPAEPTILAFDTSAAHCAAALLSGGRIVASAHEEMGRGQAERLMGLLEEVLADGGKGWREGLYLQVLGDGLGHAPVFCTMDALPELPARAEPACIGHRAGEIAAACAGHVALPVMTPAEAMARIAAARLDSTRERPAPLYIRPADAAPSKDTAPVILG